jgi:nitroimidazol reductase NimA-like FMN-containing flavoprotein (pyridoxamine 5'-phosphate oxidase superfamily)
MTPTASAAYEELAREECLQLLASFAVGRVALVTVEGSVLVVPVNYVLDGEVIVFRSDPGEKLDAIHGRHASFQIDYIDPHKRTGWSVLVRGTAHRASHREIAHLNVESWVGGDKQVWVRVVPRSITGRRLAAVDIPLDSRGYL